jgi:ACS family sodium-dependent inorganic phosphate cotransporter
MIQTPEEWQAVFYIAGGVYLAGAVFYGLFASGDRQKWADIPDSYALCRDDQSHASTDDMPYGAGSCE